jgi:hypothetical protein
MKKYLFGLGAMLVGAGLMFVLMHGEVEADDMPKIKCEVFRGEADDHRQFHPNLAYCKIKDLTCVSEYGYKKNSTLSCVKS